MRFELSKHLNSCFLNALININLKSIHVQIQKSTHAQPADIWGTHCIIHYYNINHRASKLNKYDIILGRFSYLQSGL